ncbi:peptidoglycan-binding domain-containing protein [Streptomyces purpurascens]|uniref:Peptidoglycan-binding protein n=1 Tax=Streptomyces purpurascens TaxID=1924 RepID=A0ABZ1MQF9_STREF|nr:peptidoglycan-binding domain-containing protein [Streptomyces purpurascens]MCE7045449.1 peptidoglycan-binding protein [Streptomyces purpurascens]
MVLLAGLSLSGTTATAADSATYWCNKTLGRFINAEGHQLTNIPAYGSTDSCITGQGASGSHVKAIQNALRHCHGRTKVEVDGHFGPITEQELEIVQGKLDLTADGVYGPKTRDKLRWLATTGNCGTVS